MKPAYQYIVLAAFCLIGRTASAAIVDLSFEGFYENVQRGLTVDNDGLGGNYELFEDGAFSFVVSIAVDDTDLVPVSDADGEHWNFQGEIVSYDFPSNTVASELLGKLSGSLRGIYETEFSNLVEVQYSALNTGQASSEGYMRLYGSVTGSESASDEYYWNSQSLLFYLNWGPEAPGVNSGNGMLAQDFASYVESTEYLYGLADYWSSLHDSETWTFETLALTGFDIRAEQRQQVIVPEPASVLLVGLGLLGRVLRRRERSEGGVSGAGR